MQCARYPVHEQEIEIIGKGYRGWGSHIFASEVWGIEGKEYLKKAGADWQVITDLIKSGSLIELKYQGKNFYMRKLPGKV